jgi:hypothetical protein
MHSKLKNKLKKNNVLFSANLSYTQARYGAKMRTSKNASPCAHHHCGDCRWSQTNL